MKIMTPRAMRPLAEILISDKTFDIEFHGYLTNHVKHAVIALERLDAPESRVKEYWDNYTTLTPYGLSIHKVEQDWNSVQPASLDQWNQWRGEKIRWQEQVAFLNKELLARDGDTQKLVADYAPDILTGTIGALTHAIIHLGWAIDAGSPWMITEGLAYLNFAHVAIDDSKLQWDVHTESTPLQSFSRIAKVWKEQNLGATWIQEAKSSHDTSFRPELVQAGFQWDVAKVLDRPHPVATKLPVWISRMSLEDIFESLYRLTVYIYLATSDQDGNGNFVVLHLITSLWGLEKTLQFIDDESLIRKALAHYFAGIVCLLSASSNGFPKEESLEAIQSRFPSELVDAEEFDWTGTSDAAIAEEEEHNIKLVYVTQALWHRYNRWTGFSEAANSFTVTPNISPQKTEFTN